MKKVIVRKTVASLVWMKYFWTFFFIVPAITLNLGIMLCLYGCNESDEPNSIEISINSIEFSFTGEKKELTIESNTSWTISCSETDWLTISPSSGSKKNTVTITATANSLSSQRSAIITVSGGNVSRTINVTQQGVSLFLSDFSLSFSSSSGSKTVAITSNESWTVSSDASWLTVSPSSGLSNGTVTVKCSTNTSIEERIAKITVSCNNFMQTINVTQQGIPVFLIVSPSSLMFYEQKELFITTNSGWSVNVSNDATSWLAVSPSSGSNSGTVTVTAAANPSTSPRIATITVNGDNITRTVSVTQSGIGLLVSESSLSFSSSSDSKNVTVASSANWTVTNNASYNWLSVYPSSGSKDGSFNVNAISNYSSSERSATLTVSGGGGTKTISVTQSGAGGTISFYASTDFGGSINVAVEGHGTKTIYKHSLTTPNCGGENTATFSGLPFGTYSVTATCGVFGWSGHITVNTTSCQLFKLYLVK